MPTRIKTKSSRPPRKSVVQMYDGEWVRITMKGQREMCCDCGMVHDLDFRFVDGHLEFRGRTNDRATHATRRGAKTRARIAEVLNKLLMEGKNHVDV